MLPLTVSGFLLHSAGPESASLNDTRGPAMDTVDVEHLIERVNSGDRRAFDSLVTVAYTELHRMASALMRNQSPGHTLQPTALINEAWIGLNGATQRWEGKAHFFGAAARAMRQVLIVHAREKAAQKRFGGAVRITFDEPQVQAPEPKLDLLILDQALNALSAADERLAQVMELRYFAGCTLADIAELSGRLLATVKRDWTFARAWLYEYMSAC